MQPDHGDKPAPKLTETSKAGSTEPTASRGFAFERGAVPKQIGQYHVKRVIASGGMGTVYEAVQEHPRRTVALKVMKHGVASRSALRRFEHEAQLLGRLRHPGVAQVYEAGTYDDPIAPGEVVPYFAMEYIPNAKPITKFVDEKGLRTRARLELFAQVCDAVHHGHQKGIIHRDLKPGNLLVDSAGQVKIIDFGVARSTDSDMAVTTLQTDIGQLVGTLQYMSPEQCEADPHDLDIRSDVYALGVVLYQVLTGKPPYNLGSKPFFEITRTIREQQPARLHTVDATLRGDVETVVFKALEKDREQRYQSALELAQDIRRYLANQAIIAQPPSILYQLRVFARRNRALFGATAAVFAVLLIAVAVSTWQAVRATRAEQSAKRNAAVAQAVVNILSPRTSGDHQAEVAVRNAVGTALEELGSRSAEGPLVEADIRAELADAYWRLAQFAEAERQAKESLALRRAGLGREHRDTLASMDTLAVLYKYQGRHDEAGALYRETLDTRRRVLGEEDPDTLQSMNNLAVLLRKRGRLDEAERLHRQAWTIRTRTLGPKHPDTLSSAANLAVLLREKGELDEAEPLAREVLETRREVLGPEHPDTLQSMNNFARLLVTCGRLDEARPLYKETLRVGRRVFGEKHPRVATTLRNLAKLHRTLGNDLAAEPLLAEALAIRRGKLGDEDNATLAVVIDLATCQAGLGKFEQAETVLRETHAHLETTRGAKDPQTRQVTEALADVYEAWGRPDEANAWRARLNPRNASMGELDQEQ